MKRVLTFSLEIQAMGILHLRHLRLCARHLGVLPGCGGFRLGPFSRSHWAVTSSLVSSRGSQLRPRATRTPSGRPRFTSFRRWQPLRARTAESRQKRPRKRCCTALCCPLVFEEGMFLAITMAPMYLAALPVGLISGAERDEGTQGTKGAGLQNRCVSRKGGCRVGATPRSRHHEHHGNYGFPHPNHLCLLYLQHQLPYAPAEITRLCAAVVRCSGQLRNAQHDHPTGGLRCACICSGRS